MIFRETPLPHAYVIELERYEDERGFFARTWCREEFGAQGLSTELVQCSVSFNKRSGTLRGMHYQESPYAEAKLIRCTRGQVYDVIIDLRPDSPTFRKYHGEKLSAENRLMMYAPEGFAHGFITLEDSCELFYQMSAVYEPSASRGVRFDDPAFGIRWPVQPQVISDRDRSYPNIQF